MVKMYALFKSVGAAFSAGRDTVGRGFFFDLGIPERYDFKDHQSDYYAALIKALGGEVDPADGAIQSLDRSGGRRRSGRLS